MAPTTTRTRLTDQEKMKICEDYSISRTGVYKILREKDEFTPAKVFTQSPETKVLKEQLAAKDAKKKQKSISHFFQNS